MNIYMHVLLECYLPNKSLTVCLIIDVTLTAWLSNPSLVKYRSSCAMQEIYHLEHDTSLDPAIVFGSTHHYHTRLSSRHIRPEHCRLSTIQKSFRHIIAHWWNDCQMTLLLLPPSVVLYMIIFYVMMFNVLIMLCNSAFLYYCCAVYCVSLCVCVCVCALYCNYYY